MPRATRSVLTGLAIALLCAACTGDGDSGTSHSGGQHAVAPARPTSSSGSPAAASTPAAAEVTRPLDDILVTRYRIGFGPDWMAVDEHGLWVLVDRHPVLLVDPASGEIKGRVDTGYELPLCQGIGAGYGVVYRCQGTDLLRIDAKTLKIQGRVTLHKEYAQGHIPAAFGRFWVLESDGSRLTALDPGTGDTVNTFTLPCRGWDMSADADGLWVACNIDDRVVKVAPDTGQVLVTAEVNAPEYVTAGNQVWVAGSAQTYRIDPTSGAVLATVDHGAEPVGDLTSDDRYVWVRNADDLLVQIDKESGEVVRYTGDLTFGGGLAVAGGDLWLASDDGSTLLRLRPGT